MSEFPGEEREPLVANEQDWPVVQQRAALDKKGEWLAEHLRSNSPPDINIRLLSPSAQTVSELDELIGPTIDTTKHVVKGWVLGWIGGKWQDGRWTSADGRVRSTHPGETPGVAVGEDAKLYVFSMSSLGFGSDPKICTGYVTPDHYKRPISWDYPDVSLPVVKQAVVSFLASRLSRNVD
jgi:hypothetical protein